MPFWLHQAAGKAPDRVAVETPERSLTYAELSAAAVEAADTLRGLGASERVAIALPSGADFVIALHACILAGMAAVPIDLRHTAEEQRGRRAGADVIVEQPLRGGGPRWRTSPGGEPVPLAVMHTSGTTSEPKPVVLTDRNFLASALGSAVMLGLDLAERWLCPMPLTHVGGLSIPIRSAIYATTAVLHGGFDTEVVLNELLNPQRRITLVSLVPTMLARLLDAGLERPPTLRWALLGGGPISPALLERAARAGVPVAPTYGMTEACSQIATFGWPLPGVDVITQGGEVLVRGAIIAPGAADERGWLHTADLGRFDDAGRLRIIGRKADTIVTGGENVAPIEVEAVLLEHPEVADAGVYGRPDAEWGEAVVASVVLAPGSNVTPQELREHCAIHLARFKIPKEVRVVDELPRTPSGKLLRRELI
jgi:o-succinylbenzoate---CoA ligase